MSRRGDDRSKYFLYYGTVLVLLRMNGTQTIGSSADGTMV